MEAQSTPGTQQKTPRRTQPAELHHRIVIIGGGTAGITVAARLGRVLDDADVAVIEPSLDHYYQPLWTLVGAGVFPKERSRRPEESVMPRETTWIQEAATAVDPDKQVVILEGGQHVGYDYLVVAPGLQIDWDGIEGLKEHLGTDGICSIYSYEQAERTWEMMRAFEGGAALFTSPATPIKCGGAPLKTLHRADAFWREIGVREKIELLFATAGSADFGGEEYVEMVERNAREKDASVYFGYDLVEVRPERREAVFQVTKGEIVSRDLLRFDLLHVVPPMRPPEVVTKSPLAYQVGPMKGYLEVNPETLGHRHYRNVFGLGDVAGLFTEKTGEKARKQATALARNLQRVIAE